MIDKFIKYLRYQKRYSEHTISAYKRDLSQFCEYIGHKESLLLTVNHTDMRSWLLTLLKEGNSRATVHRRMSSLKSFYRYLLQQGEVDSNPVAMVTLPKRGNHLPVFLREKQTDDLFECVKFPIGFIGVRDKLILKLFYFTGIRVSELSSLQESSIDYEKSTLKVLGKRKKERFIPLLPKLLIELKEYLDYRNNKVGNNIYLFTTLKNESLNRSKVYYIVRKYLSKVSTNTKCSPHVLRHTFATHLLNRGADINALKELLGHSSLAATQVYTHSTREQLKKDYKQAHPRA